MFHELYTAMSQLHDSDNRILHYWEIQERHQPVCILIHVTMTTSLCKHLFYPTFPLSSAVFFLSPLSTITLFLFLFSFSSFISPPPLYSRPFPSFSLFTFNTLSSIPFVSSATSTNPLGRGGEVAEEFSFLVKAMWSGQYRSVSPRDFKVTFEFCFVLLYDVF